MEVSVKERLKLFLKKEGIKDVDFFPIEFYIIYIHNLY